jgi:hypothetical protein
MQGDPQAAKVSVRVPSWTSTDGATATLNGQILNLTSAGNFTNEMILIFQMRDPLLHDCRPLTGDFLTLTKLWGDDTLLLRFPINLRTEAIKGTKCRTMSESFWAERKVSVHSGLE